MLVHGFSPDSLLMGTMVPIPKDKRQLVCISDNFRAITLGSTVAKLFDVVILSKEKMLLQHRICNLVLNKICPLLTAKIKILFIII